MKAIAVIIAVVTVVVVVIIVLLNNLPALYNWSSLLSSLYKESKSKKCQEEKIKELSIKRRLRYVTREEN